MGFNDENVKINELKIMTEHFEGIYKFNLHLLTFFALKLIYIHIHTYIYICCLIKELKKK